MNIDEFIIQLQRISPDKRQLPLVVYCPNGEMVPPSIKMIFKDNIMFTPDSQVEKMVITWQ